MDLKHLDYFREIVDSNFNLSKAAKKLHITQPSLSMLVTSWEKQYGIKLFDKSKGRYSSLTKEGEFIYNHSVQLLELHNNFLYSLEEIKSGFKGNIKIGIPPLIISLLFNKCLLEFVLEYPDVQLTIVEEGAIELQKQLIKGDIDIAILIEPVASNALNTTILYQDQLIAIVNKDIPLIEKNTINVKDVVDYNLIVFSENFVLNKTIVDLFKKDYLHPNITFKTSQWDLIVDIVENTKSFSILPAPVLNHLNMNNAFVKPMNPVLPWTVLMATNKSKIKTSSTKFLEEYIINYFKDHQSVQLNT